MRHLFVLLRTVTSETSICNIALGLIGAGRISDINGTTPVERDCKAIFADARDEVLGKHHWRFARHRVVLAKLTDTPIYGYSFKYQLPTDFISAITLSDPDTKYELVGDTVECNVETDCFLEYTRRITNAALFSPQFIIALAHRLAAPLAMMVKKDRRTSGYMWDLYAERIDSLEAEDAKGDKRETPSTNPWVDARGE